ncbi:MAG TPA: NHL repeat-containing protein [Blastocatellia bacterium]
MRRVLIAVLILILPTATAVTIYFIVNKKIPTKREAIGSVMTIAGAGHPGVEDGPARSASFSDPFGVAVDKRGNVFVADGGQSNRIRRLTPDGKVETIAGSTEGFADGDALQAQFNTPSGIAIDKNGSIIIADTSNNRIRKLSPNGKATTLAGSGAVGQRDGAAIEAEFDGPIGVAVDKRGNVFVADSYNDRIREITSDGKVVTIAGTGLPGFTDGNASTAAFNTPSGVAVDERGNIFVADTGNSAVRRITPQGDVSTVIANGQQLSHPVGIAITHDGFLFVTDTSRVVRIAPDGSAETYAGGAAGFADGLGESARLSGPSGIAIDREGNLFVADRQNYLIREIEPSVSKSAQASSADKSMFIQPSHEPIDPKINSIIPILTVDMPVLTAEQIGVGNAFPWPFDPQNQPHEITGVIGEARGATGGVALDHLHGGLDIRGNQGEPVLSVLDEKVGAPTATWDYGGTGEGIQIGLMSYIHTRVGRNARDEVQSPDKFKLIVDSEGKTVGVRVRRGARFKVGDFIGTVNRMYHVHLNLGPRNAEANPLELPFIYLKDTTPPVVEGIEIVRVDGLPLTERVGGRLVVKGDVRIVVTAFDRVDGNGPNRKLGLYRVGYQFIDERGDPAKGFEQPLINIEFNRLMEDSVRAVYAEGSGVSAYGTPTNFKYIVTNRFRDGQAREGFLRTEEMPSGNYMLRIVAEDYAGNRASGKSAELPVTIRN